MGLVNDDVPPVELLEVILLLDDHLIRSDHDIKLARRQLFFLPDLHKQYCDSLLTGVIVQASSIHSCTDSHVAHVTKDNLHTSVSHIPSCACQSACICPELLHMTLQNAVV